MGELCDCVRHDIGTVAPLVPWLLGDKTLVKGDKTYNWGGGTSPSHSTPEDLQARQGLYPVAKNVILKLSPP